MSLLELYSMQRSGKAPAGSKWGLCSRERERQRSGEVLLGSGLCFWQKRGDTAEKWEATSLSETKEHGDWENKTKKKEKKRKAPWVFIITETSVLVGTLACYILFRWLSCKSGYKAGSYWNSDAASQLSNPNKKAANPGTHLQRGPTYFSCATPTKIHGKTITPFCSSLKMCPSTCGLQSCTILISGFPLE